MKNVKEKVMAILLTLIMVLSFTACGGNSSQEADATQEEAKQEETKKEDPAENIVFENIKGYPVDMIPSVYNPESETVKGFVVEMTVTNENDSSYKVAPLMKVDRITKDEYGDEQTEEKEFDFGVNGCRNYYYYANEHGEPYILMAPNEKKTVKFYLELQVALTSTDSFGNVEYIPCAVEPEENILNYTYEDRMGEVTFTNLKMYGYVANRTMKKEVCIPVEEWAEDAEDGIITNNTGKRWRTVSIGYDLADGQEEPIDNNWVYVNDYTEPLHQMQFEYVDIGEEVVLNEVSGTPAFLCYSIDK